MTVIKQAYVRHYALKMNVHERLGAENRNGCRGPLGAAIDIATRYRKSRIRSISGFAIAIEKSRGRIEDR